MPEPGPAASFSRGHQALLLTPLAPYGEHALLVLRVLIGAFLVWGVADNILSAERMQEFAAFLGRAGFPIPRLIAPLSVWAQFFIGIAFVLGLLTRWAGVICVINFAVALVMVDSQGGIRGAFPSACLMLIGAYLATHGAGRFSIDAMLRKPDQQSA